MLCNLSSAVLGEPRRVRVEAINSTAIFVEWRPPNDDEKNGIIRGYQIRYTRVNQAGDSVGLPQMWDNTEFDEKTEAVITGLQPDSWYEVQVAAYTRKGDGLRSKTKTAKTKGAGNLFEYHHYLKYQFEVCLPIFC